LVQRFPAVTGLADHFDIRLVSQEGLDALPNYYMVIHQ
jgi:hypothetical protein